LQKVVPGTTVVYRYDDLVKANGVGRLSGVTDGSGGTEFFYDVLGREIKTIKTVDSVAYVFERAYDALNRVVALTYPDGEVVTYRYNPQGIEAVSSPAATYVSDVDYTATGQIAEQAVNGSLMTTTYTYDSNTLRLSAMKAVNGARMALQDVSYAFDGVGNVTALTDHRRGWVQTFRYDDLHRLTEAVGPGTYGSRSYGYDAVGNLTLKDGVTQVYGDPMHPHAVTSRSDGLTMTYDANGNMITKGAQALVYDAEQRLVEVMAAPVPTVLMLRPGWNLVSFPRLPEGAASATFAEVFGAAWGSDDGTGAIDQVSRWNSATQAFEHAGPDAEVSAFDRLEAGRGYEVYVVGSEGVVLSFEWEVGEAAPAALPGGWALLGGSWGDATPVAQALGSLQGSYDQALRFNGSALEPAVAVDFGEAVYVHLTKPATWAPLHPRPVRFIYDGDGGRVQKVTASGTTTYIGKLWEVKPDGSAVKYIWVGATRLASKSSTGTLLFYHPNHLGSTDLVTDSQGTQVAHYEYTPYGELWSTEGITVPHQYTGKERDPETGFYFYEARYYDPQLGRFLTPDTIVPNWTDPQDFNRYSYAGNNPLKYTDPTGHSKFWRKVGKFFRQWVAPVAAAIVAIVVFAAVTTVAGPFVASTAASMASSATYNGISTFGANLERGRGFFESYGRGMLATGATLIGGPIGGGAASAALVGGDPGRGAALGAVQAGFAVAGAFIPVPTSPFLQAGRAAAFGAAQGATGAAIVGGDPGKGAAYGAASAAAVTAAVQIGQTIIDGPPSPSDSNGQQSQTVNLAKGKGQEKGESRGNWRRANDWQRRRIAGELGESIHDTKGRLGAGGKQDIWIRDDGEAVLLPKDGGGPGEPIGVNVKDLTTSTVPQQPGVLF